MLLVAGVAASPKIARLGERARLEGLGARPSEDAGDEDEVAGLGLPGAEGPGAGPLEGLQAR